MFWGCGDCTCSSSSAIVSIDRKHPSGHVGEGRARDSGLSYDAGVWVQAAC